MSFDQKEANDRLEAIVEIVRLATKQDMLLSSRDILTQIVAVAVGADIVDPETPDTPKQVVISCDASIQENPGGPSALGVVIEVPGRDPLSMSRRSRATTNNIAEYEAVYFGLTSLFGLINNPQCPVEVRSDSRLVVCQLNGDMQCRDEKLQRKKDLILEFTKELPVPVKFVWRPRNSTPELKLANYLAQDELGVPRH